MAGGSAEGLGPLGSKALAHGNLLSARHSHAEGFSVSRVMTRPGAGSLALLFGSWAGKSWATDQEEEETGGGQGVTKGAGEEPGWNQDSEELGGQEGDETEERPSQLGVCPLGPNSVLQCSPLPTPARSDASRGSCWGQEVSSDPLVPGRQPPWTLPPIGSAEENDSEQVDTPCLPGIYPEAHGVQSICK